MRQSSTAGNIYIYEVCLGKHGVETKYALTGNCVRGERVDN